MLNLFKPKSTQEIEIRARASQRENDEKFWTRRLNEQTNTFLLELEKQKESLNRKKAVEMQELRTKFNNELRIYKQKVVEANEKVRNAQLAFSLYKDGIPRALDYANIIRSALFVKQQEITRITGSVHGAEEGLEGLQRLLIDIGPKIDKLLGNNNQIEEDENIQ